MPEDTKKELRSKPSSKTSTGERPKKVKQSERDRLVKKLQRDPKALAKWLRETLIENVVTLSEIARSGGEGYNADSIRIQAIKEITERTELLLEEAAISGATPTRPTKGEQNLSPAKNRSTVGARKPWQPVKEATSELSE